MHHSSKTSGLLLSLLLAVCLFGHIAQAKYSGSGMAASAETSTYVFLPDQSKLVQTGGIAGVPRTYSVKGEFQLTVDPNAGAASFAHVDANATDDSPFKRTLDLNHVFNMISLVGTVVDDTTLKFTGKAPDDSDVAITVTLQEGLAHLIGQTTPPPNSADFFIFSLDAVAQLRKYGGGSGTAEDPYQIATAADLIALGESPEDYDKHFILTADIDLDPNLPDGKVFNTAVIAPRINEVPYSDVRAFTGTFNGNGFKIKHLTIQGGPRRMLGLFGKVGKEAKICNLGLENVSIRGDNSGILGALSGSNHGYITHCYSSGKISSMNRSGVLGGLVGNNEGGIITKCYSDCEVSGDQGDDIVQDYLGGLVGTNWYSGKISNSYATGAVTGDYWVGGLVGANLQADISNCYAAGVVSGTLGVGGLAGCNGRCSTIRNCLAVGRISVTQQSNKVGGLVGETETEAIISGCFWDVETTGVSENAGGTGLTTAQMQTAAPFLDADWDFVNVWGIGENQTYPYLRKYSAADINQDASVNFLDLAVLAENWLTDMAP
jgi:hypothetical protein